MRRWVLLVVILCLLLAPFSAVQAQDATQYENPELGVAFQLPADWEVQATIDTLTAGSPEAIAALDAGGVPETLVVRVVFGTFLTLGVNNASELPGFLGRLVPPGMNVPEPVPVNYGNSEGWEIEYTIVSSGLSSKVALLALPNGRIGLVRGLSSTASWDAGVEAEFDTLKQSFTFSIPGAAVDPLAATPDEDGGVIWQYQAPQPADSPEVRLGGLDFDPFEMMYIAAGQRGILVLDQTTGEFVNYLGPWSAETNIVDLEIPIDARIYAANAIPAGDNHIMVINRAGGIEYSFGETGDGEGQFAPGMPQTIAVGRSYEVWTISEGHSTPPAKRLYHFDRWGNLLDMIDIDTINPNLSNIRMDNNTDNGGLYLIGETGGLNLLDSDGSPLVIDLAADIFATTTPASIAVAPGDNIIIGTNSAGFLQFAPSGALLDRFGLSYDSTRTDPFQPGEILNPPGIVSGLDDTLYFAETNPATGMSQVQAFVFAGDGNLALPNRPESGQGVTTVALDPTLGGGPISYGQVVQSSLNNQYPMHEWYLEGEPGQHIRITMRDITPDQALDTRLSLLNPSRLEIAGNDDVGSIRPDGFRETDSVIEFVLSDFGTHTIQATRFGGRGEYELLVELITPEESSN